MIRIMHLRAPSACEPAAAPERRSDCQRCGLPAARCLCPWVRATANEVELRVLQHPQEAGHAKGSVPLLALSLARCHVRPWRAQDPALDDWLAPSATSEETWLLYPDPDPGLAGVIPAAPAPTAARPRHLLVLDATWRKSLRMLATDRRLQALPRLALSVTAAPAPRYAALRQARRAGQWSTLEACCLALGPLEGRPDRYEALLDAFAGYVRTQARPVARRVADDPGAVRP